MKQFLTIWITFQLITLGLSGGVQYRELTINGCIDTQREKKELTLGDWVVPVIFPLALFTTSLEEYKCK